MTVEQLIKKLQKVKNPKSTVLLSSDQEGNSFNILSDIENNSELVYNADDGEIGIGFGNLTVSLKSQGCDEDDILPNGKPCIILYP